MTNLVIQPASSETSKAHFVHTVDPRHRDLYPKNTPFPPGAATMTPGMRLSDPHVRNELTIQDLQVLRAVHGMDGNVAFWGVTDKVGGDNLRNWTKINAGDRVIFTGKVTDLRTGKPSKTGYAYATGVVTHKFRNHALAERLWGVDDNGHAWELMYAIADVTRISIDYATLNAATLKKDGTPYNPRNVPQGFDVLPPEQVEAVFKLPSLADLEPRRADLEAQTIEEELRPFVGETDAEQTAQRRLEQGALRKHLLPGSTGVCDLCGRTFSERFLVAAHIKPRSQCTGAERVDFDNVAMLNCVFGCDALFDKGYIAVQPDGRIKASRLLSRTEMSYVTANLVTRPVSARSSGRALYFDWHERNKFKP
ncbi:HNH endonuclease signature motif containing protein [Demequina sp. NBRC 110054]|uniref:HNH endonuclease signature motif containing protein n=1 Tax=Demequina sp. NBRC 110054 TaxID=1570343 RepID=UPI00117821C4|nr:HNH endonuclease signature motif containing protein [Demequina sp. NBRC 110054]